VMARPGEENYPDDIHQYDNDPRSPFYVEPQEPESLEDEGDRLYQQWKDDQLDRRWEEEHG